MRSLDAAIPEIWFSRARLLRGNGETDSVARTRSARRSGTPASNPRLPGAQDCGVCRNLWPLRRRGCGWNSSGLSRAHLPAQHGRSHQGIEQVRLYGTVIGMIVGWPVMIVFGFFAWDSARYSMRYFGGPFSLPPGTTDAEGYLMVPENVLQALLNLGIACILGAIAYGGHWLAGRPFSRT